MLDRIKGMKKADAKRLLFFHAFFWAFSNLINPITPAMFLELGLPDYMFGVLPFGEGCAGKSAVRK